jgi:predicted ATPase
VTARLTILLGLDFVTLTDATIARQRGGAVIEVFPEMRGHFPLHPSLHGEVADRIIRDAQPADGLLARRRAVCTHSDPFVLRVRWRIAEGTLPPAEVALVWVLPDGSETAIPLNDRGTPEWWPKGVFAEAQEEFHAIRRALAERDRKSAIGRAEQPTIPEQS